MSRRKSYGTTNPIAIESIHMSQPSTNTSSIFGLSAAMVTPFDKDGNVDLMKTVLHAKTMLANGCDGVTLFGTTSEGYGISLADRRAMLTEVAKALPDTARIHAGVIASGIDDAAALARAAYEDGACGLLLAPPFFMKGICDDGLFNWFSAVFDKIGSPLKDVILYHIPGQTAVPISVSLVSRIRAAYPGIVTGIKDSSGDWASTEAYLATHGDIAILVGDERQLPRAMAHGAQGSICGTANFMPSLLRDIIHGGSDGAAVTKIVEMVVSRPIIPAVKVLTAHINGDASFVAPRPPLMPLPDADALILIEAFDAVMASA
jgi:4-hydroxy-tetrahydrodipicolinate synthase